MRGLCRGSLQDFMKMNRIAVRTNKGEYVGGEKIYGAVYLWICSTDPCRGVKLKFKGSEKCEWQYKEAQEQNGRLVEHVGTKVSKKELFRAEVRLIEYPDGIPMGCYVYPFQFTLTQGLPGSFQCRGVQQHNGNEWSADIKYKVVAELDTTSHGDPLKSTQLVTLNENLPLTSVDPEVETAERTVKICCCIPRGSVLLNAWMNQRAYISGESAQLNAEVRNNSSVDIDSFLVKLVRVVNLKPQEQEASQSQEGKASWPGRMPVIVDNVLDASQRGCPGKQDRKCVVPMKLTSEEFPEGFQPSTNGSVIICRYHVDIEMDIKWAEPISVQIPVTLKAPRNKAWHEWDPPRWVHDCKVVKVPIYLHMYQAFRQTHFRGHNKHAKYGASSDENNSLLYPGPLLNAGKFLKKFGHVGKCELDVNWKWK